MRFNWKYLAGITIIGSFAALSTYQLSRAQVPPAEEVIGEETAPETTETRPYKPSGPSTPAPTVTFGTGEYLLKYPPSDIEKYYPPVFKRYEYSRLMDSLAKYFYELKIDVNEGDWDYVEFSFRLFARQYKLMADMHPGMSEFFRLEYLDQLAKQLNIQSPEQKAQDTAGYTPEPEEMAHEEEELTKEGEPKEGMVKKTNPEAVKTIEKIENESCKSCHYLYRPATYFAFYWGTRGMKYDMISFRMKDPVTGKKDISYKEFMMLLGESYYGIMNGIDKGEKRYVRLKLKDFAKRMDALDATCMKCHWEEPDKYMLKTVKPQMKALDEEAKRYKPRKDILNKNLAYIYENICSGCHMIHMPVYQIQEIWKGEKGSAQGQ
ncbi:MAG: hypothetical protein ABIN54_06320 [candidate division WOR-3 bacterium]